MLSTYTVTHGGDSGAGSLRWAIDSANNHVGEHDEIAINADVTEISITGDPLPAIEHGVYIEYLGVGQDGAGRVEVNYSAYPSSPNVSGLVIDIGAARDVEIRGLRIQDFTGSGILVADDLDDLTIANCTIDSNNGDGIRIADSAQPNYVWIYECVITRAYGGNGIGMLGSTYLRVQDSYVGTNADAGTLLGNEGSGIYCAGTGTVIVTGCTIGGNGQNGIELLGDTDVTVANSYIGTSAAADELSNLACGIYCAGTGSLSVSGSTICANFSDGIRVEGPGDATLEVHIHDNMIGVALDESEQVVPLANAGCGIQMFDCNGIINAGDNENVAVEVVDNTISSNSFYGVLLQRSSYVKIDGCVISYNGEEAIQIRPTGSVAPSGHIRISDNTISANGGEAVCMFDRTGAYLEYVDVIGNTLANNNQPGGYSAEIATWNGAYSNHCRFSQNNFSTLDTKEAIKFEVLGSNEGILPPVIGNISFGYDATADENVWTIPFTVNQTQSVFTNAEFVFEVYASNVHFEYEPLLQAWTYGPGDYVYLDGCDVEQHLTGLQGSFTATVPASQFPLGFTSFLITATCVEVVEDSKDRNDTSVFSEAADTPPQVTGVKVSNGTDEYSIPADRDSGSQLHCVPFRYDAELGYAGPPNVTEIQVAFNQDVEVVIGDLTLVNANDENTSYSPTGFTSNYVDGVETATWTFNPITWKQLILTISDDVTGAEGLALDGEWTNPMGFDETGNSVFPSGNGVDGEESEDFIFFFTVPSPADFNLDGKVDDLDGSILGSHWLQQVDNWGPGDANGDGVVNGADSGILAAHWYTDFTTWPTQQDKSGGGSKPPTRLDIELALDSLFESYDLDAPEEARAVEFRDRYWDEFLDDFLGRFNELAA